MNHRAGRMAPGFWLVLCGFLMTGPEAIAAGESRQAKILAIIPAEDEPVRVVLITELEFGLNALGGILPALISSAKSSNRNKPLDDQLRKTLAGYERTPILADAVKRGFENQSAVFQVTTTTDRERYFQTRGMDKLTPVAAAEGFDYVLLMESEFVGLWMAGACTLTDDLTPAQAVRYRLLRVQVPTVMQKGMVTGHGIERRHYKLAVTDRDFFVKLWPEVCTALASSIVGELKRGDQLHVMARSVGRGDEVPAIGAVLKKYENTFKFDLEPVEGWREVRMDSKYVRVLEPKDSTNQVMGIRFEVDLLVPEFGQDVDTLDEYLLAFSLRRLGNNPTFPPMEKWDGIHAPGFEVYLASDGAHARSITLYRMLGERKIQFINVVFLRDFDKLYAANRTKIEKMIADSTVTLR